ncbi:MAG: tetratricopeptide repeat protein [Candidatus Brocadiales bacterium]|nr:tetratricopeptide repeat protein [Candidatus Brocadiales bacterium]
MGQTRDLSKQAFDYHQAGDLANAEALYLKILEEDPQHVDIVFLLGTLYLQSGNPDAAITFLKETIKLKPDHVEAYNNLGTVFLNQGKLEEAVEKYNSAINLAPDYAEAFYNLGSIFYKQRKFVEALEHYKQVILLRPDDYDAHLNIGNTFKELGEPEEAEKSYRRSSTLKPDYAIAHSRLGIILQEQGKFDESTKSLKRAITLDPANVDFHNNLGTVLTKLGKLDEAVESYNRAIKLNPEEYRVYSNLASALSESGKLEEALINCNKAIKLNPHYAEAHNNLGIIRYEQYKLNEAISCYQQALQIDPDNAETLHNLGIVLHLQDKHDEALSCYQKALNLKPDFAGVYINIGNMHKEHGKTNEAISCYKKALLIKPDPGVEIKTALMLPIINESQESIKQYRDKLVDQIKLLETKNLTIDDPHKQVGSTNFYLVYHGLNDRKLQEMITAFYIRVCPDLTWTSPNHNKLRQPDDKIKIGIISKFLSNHTIGTLNHGIIKHLSRERFHVKLFGFIEQNEDSLTSAINSSADEVVVLPRELRAARQEIADHSLDVLFYLDIGMDPLTYFLAFSRLAPVQCVTWGHPVTTGIPNIDYFISSETAEQPGAEKYYSEQLVLPGRLTTYYYRPKLPEVIRSREYFGFSKDCNLYICPQSLFKFHPDFDDILGKLLRQDQRGLLVLIEGKHKHWTKLLKDRFADAFPDVIDRVKFVPRMPTNDYLSLLKSANVLLDTPYFGGGSTSMEAFACSTPIVTLPGEYLCSRLTLALYRQLNIMDCVARDTQDYLKIAYRLANDTTWRNEIVEKIEANAHRLYEDIDAVHELERFFEMAVEKVYGNNLLLEPQMS